MSRPPKATLVLSSIESLGKDAVIGIDTQFFTVNTLLRGIKLVPAGIHLFHFSNSINDGTSVRFGWWFECKESDIFCVDWSEDKCSFKPQATVPPELGDMYQHMVGYPEDPIVWHRLTNYIDTEAIEEYTPGQEIPVTTATPLNEENMLLLDILLSRDPHQKIEPDSEQLRYTIIDHKSSGVGSNAQVSQVTESARDRSWYLRKLFGHDLEILLAELQLCFVHFVVLGNLCSCTQWLSLMKLILMSSSFLSENQKFGEQAVSVIIAQLQKLPPDYISPDLDLAVVDLAIYFDVMENFYHSFGNSRMWAALRDANRPFGITLNFHSLFDEENFEVYNIKEYDADDEDAPAIVQ